MAVGSRGDVEPAIALAGALRRAGYDVTLGAPQAYRKAAEAVGAEFRPIDIDWQAAIHSPEARAAIRAGAMSQFRTLRAIMAGWDQSLTVGLHEATRGADALVFHPLLGFAADIAEARAIPAIVYSAVPIAPTAEFPLCLIPRADLGPLNRMSYAALRIFRLAGHRALSEARRDLLGLNARPISAAPFAVGGRALPSIAAVSPSVVPRPADWPAAAHQTGFWFAGDDGGWRPDPALTAFLSAGDPPLYVGFGSMPFHDPEGSARTLLAALGKSGTRAVVGRGWSGFDPRGAGSGAVHAIDQAPFARLFPLVAGVVHHGGVGTLALGLKAGRPTLVCPMFNDQFFWGRRAHALGVGPAPLPVDAWTVETLAAAFVDLKSNSGYGATARRLSAALEAEDGLGDAVRLISKLISR